MGYDTDTDLVCPTHRELLGLHPVTLRLDPPGRMSIFVDQLDVHACPIAGCGYIKPTVASQRRLFQILGEHPENTLKEHVKVAVVDWRQ